jgi:pimeloyl-ACP methyl ester carboxylesterase
VDWKSAGRASRAHRKSAPARPAERPTLLFTHGFCLPQDSWHYQRAEFSGEYRMVFWDQRGHGRSGRPRRGAELSVDVLGEDLYAVLEATCPTGPVILIGHSMGGMTMMALAEKHPELFGDRIVGAALLATSAGEFGDLAFGLPRLGAKVFHRAVPSVVDLLSKQREIVERGRRFGGDLGLVLTKRYAFGSQTPESLVRFVQEMIQSTPIDVIAAYFPIFRQHDKIAAVPVFDKVPTLVLAAGGDMLLPRTHSRVLADVIPNARFTVVEEAGHLVMLERPDEVARALRTLVADVEEDLGEDDDPPRRAAR